MTTGRIAQEFYFTAFWPLMPFRSILNEAVSVAGILGDKEVNPSRFTGNSLPLLQSHFTDYSSHFACFRRFFLQSPPFPFESANLVPCRFFSYISAKFIQTAIDELEHRFEWLPKSCGQPVSNCGQCIRVLYTLLPQPFENRVLVMSIFLTDMLRNKRQPAGFRYHEGNNIYTHKKSFDPGNWDKRSILWMAGEHIFRANEIWWGKFGLDILTEGNMVPPKANNALINLVQISFYYDEIPDLITAFVIDPSCNPEPARHLIGLTYAMKEARKASLFDWVGRLADTVMKMEEVEDFEFFQKYTHLKTPYADCQIQFNKSPDAALKKLRAIYARESLEWMARVLAFVETSPEEANDPENKAETFLDYEIHGDNNNPLMVSPALSKVADSDPRKEEIWTKILGKKDVRVARFDRSLARLKFIRDFLEESAQTINSALDVKGVVKIEGSKSVALKADLLRHVRLNPMTGKVLLLGEPGGGKGITSKRFHSLSIEEIRKDDSLLQETVEAVADKLISIFMLPEAQGIISAPVSQEGQRAEKLLGFVKAQLQGTMWWNWGMPEKNSVHGASPWDCRSDGLCTRVPSDFANILDGELEYEPCESCPLRNYVEILRPKFKPLNLIHNTKSIRLSIQFMAHYLARLLYEVYGLGNNPKPKDKSNYIQVLCGVLASQGPEFISSMRRLFGTAENVETPLPGLFQTASYMAGTIFLDEIGDCPIKIQDNLLGPLEEKKVARLGWESIEEDVSNIRIVAATHKDLRAKVKQYRATMDSDTPKGFRPDLLSRLALFPPVYPSSVTDYLLYENKNRTERAANRMEFISIMLSILNEKAGDVKHPDDDLRRRFFGNLFDTVDKYIQNTMAMMDFSEARFSEIRKNLVKKITTRLFVGIVDALALAERQAEHFAEASKKNSDKQPSVETKGLDIEAIIETTVKARQKEGNNDMKSRMESRLRGFYSQTEEQIKRFARDFSIDEKEGSDMKKALLDGFESTIDRVIKTSDSGSFNGPRETFLNARMSEIIGVNLPKLLNFIVTSDV